MKKDATLKARVPSRIAELVGETSNAQGIFHTSDYIRIAILNQLSKDTGKSIAELIKAAA